jgi:hypothetical protein
MVAWIGEINSGRGLRMNVVGARCRRVVDGCHFFLHAWQWHESSSSACRWWSCTNAWLEYVHVCGGHRLALYLAWREQPCINHATWSGWRLTAPLSTILFSFLKTSFIYVSLYIETFPFVAVALFVFFPKINKHESAEPSGPDLGQSHVHVADPFL